MTRVERMLLLCVAKLLLQVLTRGLRETQPRQVKILERMIVRLQTEMGESQASLDEGRV